ncbi:MAG: hypothetical protein HRT90_03095 [Candidatus Margulisbacteria bacterium]|nr:hypothetical protein [Candidatus Margulisiibacteriota bacterium]
MDAIPKAGNGAKKILMYKQEVIINNKSAMYFKKRGISMMEKRMPEFAINVPEYAQIYSLV